MTNIKEALGIDIGGTGIKVSLVDIRKGKLIRSPIKVSTPQPAEPESILPLLRDFVKKYNWTGPVGCGFPGVIKRGTVLTAANLSDRWIGINLKSEIEKMTNFTASIINDADGAALAEMQFGAGRDFIKKDAGVVMLFTLGTGIGSALFVDGKLVPNTEFGHMEMDGKDAEDWAATVIREQENLSWKSWGERVDKFLKRIEILFTPDLIIIGGGVSENPEKFFKYLNVKAKLVPALLANDAGIIGAALSTHIV